MPRRERALDRSARWPANLGIAALNTLLARLILSVGLFGFALEAHEHEWGVLNNFGFPHAAVIVVSFVGLDLAIYLQHVMFHAVPALWRVHRMHHSDLDFELTTGIRFHPVEILLSLGFKLAIVGIHRPQSRFSSSRRCSTRARCSIIRTFGFRPLSTGGSDFSS